MAKTKALISFAVTAKLICSAPLFSYRQKSGFLMARLILFPGSLEETGNERHTYRQQVLILLVALEQHKEALK